MPTTAWIAIASLGLAITVQTAAFAYFLGRLSQRVDGLSKAGEGHGDVALAFAEFKGSVEATMKAQGGHIESIDRTMQGMQRTLSTLATGGGFKPLMTDT